MATEEREIREMHQINDDLCNKEVAKEDVTARESESLNEKQNELHGRKENLEQQLRKWRTRHEVSGRCFDDLVNILVSYGLDVSESAQGFSQNKIITELKFLQMDTILIEQHLEHFLKKMETVIQSQAETIVHMKELLRQNEQKQTLGRI